MPSAIDPTQPPQGQATTAAIRANFAAAKAEILALQAQAGAFAQPTVGGTADAIIITNVNPITSYASAYGSRNVFEAAFTNLTNTTTMNIDGLGALPLMMGAGSPPAGDILAARHYWFMIEQGGYIRIAPFDSVSSEGDTISGDLLITGHAFDTKTISAVAAAIGTNYTAADFLGGIINRSGPSAAFSDTTPTAAAIIAAIGQCVPGTSFDLEIINSSTRALTMLAGAGVTLALITGIAASQNRSYLVTVTNVAIPAVTLTGIRTSSP